MDYNKAISKKRHKRHANGVVVSQFYSGTGRTPEEYNKMCSKGARSRMYLMIDGNALGCASIINEGRRISSRKTEPDVDEVSRLGVPTRHEMRNDHRIGVCNGYETIRYIKGPDYYKDSNPLIQLDDGQWKSALTGKIYYDAVYINDSYGKLYDETTLYDDDDYSAMDRPFIHSEVTADKSHKVYRYTEWGEREEIKKEKSKDYLDIKTVYGDVVVPERSVNTLGRKKATISSKVEIEEWFKENIKILSKLPVMDNDDDIHYSYDENIGDKEELSQDENGEYSYADCDGETKVDRMVEVVAIDKAEYGFMGALSKELSSRIVKQMRLKRDDLKYYGKYKIFDNGKRQLLVHYPVDDVDAEYMQRPFMPGKNYRQGGIYYRLNKTFRDGNMSWSAYEYAKYLLNPKEIKEVIYGQEETSTKFPDEVTYTFLVQIGTELYTVSRLGNRKIQVYPKDTPELKAKEVIRMARRHCRKMGRPEVMIQKKKKEVWGDVYYSNKYQCAIFVTPVININGKTSKFTLGEKHQRFHHNDSQKWENNEIFAAMQEILGHLEEVPESYDKKHLQDVVLATLAQYSK